MKQNEKYDNSYHSGKSKVLSKWLLKTFTGVSIHDAKRMLYDCEGTMDETEEERDSGENDPQEIITKI